MTINPETTATPSDNQPSHIAYQVRDSKEKGYWTRIGAAWQHKDGKGFSLQIESIPLDGRITLRVASEQE